jgi:LuxR family maltose regulon positive regulatory protein
VARFEHVAHLLANQIAGDEATPLRLRLLQVQAYGHFWRGRWDDTLHACRAMYRLGESLGVQAWTMIEVGGLPPLCAAIRGDAVAAEAALEQLFAWIELIPSGVTIQHLPYLFWRARLRWLQGRHADVRADYEQIVTLEARYGTHPFVAAIQPLLRGLLALSAGQYDEAQREVEHAAVLQEHAPAAVIFSDARLLLAYVALRRGHTEHALAQVAPLLAAHDHADTPGHIMWEGTPAIELVQLAVERGVHAPFARRVLQLLGPAALPGTTPAPQRIVVPGSSEALSAREIEVLRLIADGASNTTIADRLIISPHTAKRHVANILGKLDAATRTEAALRARELGLV